VFGGGAVAAMVVESRIRGSMLACDQAEDERESMRSSCSRCPPLLVHSSQRGERIDRVG